MAAKFWVGGAGTWDNATTTHWATSTGGAGGAAVPAATDTVTFDGASGGGTVTVAATINGTNTLNTINMGTFTGTLDFSVNNPTITITAAFNVAPSGSSAVRTLSLGSSTINLTGVNAFVWDATTITGLTFNAGTSNITWQPASFSGKATIVTGGLHYSTITASAASFGTVFALNTNGSTVDNLVLTGPLLLFLPTMTITNAISWAGTSSGPLVIQNATSAAISAVTLSAAGNTIAWAAIQGITFATNTPVASNSSSLGNVTNATINNPVIGGGGAGAVIGS